MEQKSTRTFKTGQTVFLEGDLSDEMYIIKSGRVELVREMGDSTIVLSTLGTNEFFGEMALFGEPRRTATVRAVEDTEIFVISKKMLEAQFKLVPEWLVVMIKTIAQRIISTIKGTKARFSVGMDYSILKTILLLLGEHGIAEEKEKQTSVSLNLVRQALKDILGISTDDIDAWLKKFNFTNLIKMISSKEKLIIPDIERLEKYTEFLELKIKGSAESSGIDKNVFSSFERLHKLLNR